MKRKIQYYFYILQCRDKSLYCGITKDLKNREALHNAGKGSSYVRSRGGGKIVYTEKYKTLSQALHREIEVKKWTRVKKFKLFVS
jgi:putative endonuclease